ncbi:Na+/H+ antiporter NhaC [Halobacillus shinanisalinarum]|uniref:Na+/H+ antiporter NhaC n=1 Tax=Halobacillus shinanisalinarum TaxID=2932258 RepID=A0ABY4H3Q7_9BACI|nr:Na+/H+ antiporter NhaC [Halobacillus shinanisalinarum]UOQ94755.1 Na+/H+ antiporter NhaC [Halobacillus shinanisalinarum]
MKIIRKPSILLAAVPLVILIIAAIGAIFFWDVAMFIPLIIGIFTTGLVAKYLGYEWREIEEAMTEGISRALPAVYILIITGTIIGSWIASGIIPTIIYYGFSIIDPAYFVPMVAFFTALLAMVIGSITSLGTIGLAFMAIGQGMGFPLPLVAGAVISGAFFGDKLSPLSDTTNVASAIVNVPLYTHVKHMLWDTLPAFIIALILYWFVGNQYVGNVATPEEVNIILGGLEENFTIHSGLLTVPLITIVMMIKRVPAVPALVITSILASVCAVIFQGSTVSAILNAMTGGFVIDSGIQSIDALLNTGGILSMLRPIGMLMIATALGGLLERTYIFQVFVDYVIDLSKTTGSLISSTLLLTFVVGLSSGAQYLALILPARSFLKTFKQRNLHPKNLSRCVEATGTVGINLVPWSVPVILSSVILGVSPYQFIPFVFFAILVPVINVIYGFTGFTIAKLESSSGDDEVRSSRSVSS